MEAALEHARQEKEEEQKLASIATKRLDLSDCCDEDAIVCDVEQVPCSSMLRVRCALHVLWTLEKTKLVEPGWVSTWPATPANGPMTCKLL